jgi:hypothetical protein
VSTYTHAVVSEVDISSISSLDIPPKPLSRVKIEFESILTRSLYELYADCSKQYKQIINIYKHSNFFLHCIDMLSKRKRFIQTNDDEPSNGQSRKPFTLSGLPQMNIPNWFGRARKTNAKTTLAGCVSI